jgi:hypothetical protein
MCVCGAQHNPNTNTHTIPHVTILSPADMLRKLYLWVARAWRFPLSQGQSKGRKPELWSSVQCTCEIGKCQRTRRRVFTLNCTHKALNSYYPHICVIQSRGTARYEPSCGKTATRTPELADRSAADTCVILSSASLKCFLRFCRTQYSCESCIAKGSSSCFIMLT